MCKHEIRTEKIKNYKINRIIEINDISIYWDYETAAGGGSFGLDFLDLIPKRYNKVFSNCLECFSGSGVIGFGLLATNSCEKITFNDIYQGAINNIAKTVRKNPALENKVNYYLGDNIKSIPKNNKYDLIIGLPPHTRSNDPKLGPNDRRLKVDEGYKIHEEFFKHAKNYLTDDGIIIILEDTRKNSPKDFIKMIEENGLQINEVFLHKNKNHYYIEIVHSKNSK